MKEKQWLKKTVPALLVGAEAAVIADLACVCLGGRLPMSLFWLLFAGTAAGALLAKIRVRALRRVFWWVFSLGLASVLLTAGLLFGFARSSRYEGVDEGKAALFGDKSVLIVAPHEDDELNIAGGVIEEYVRYGSRVTLLFTTNGDFADSGERRLREALSVAAKLGVDEEDVIFLGYGDQLGTGTTHIYNAPEDEVLTSAAWCSATYGLPGHPAYNEGNTYTRRHFYEDLRDAVLQLRPDVIFCTEYEPHSDHCAAALLLDEAMGEILRTVPDYQPLLLKTPCYHTAYYGAEDFYQENMRATQNPFDGPYAQEAPILRWEDRVRLPVSTDTLARSLFGSSTYWQLRLYASQGAVNQAEGIISGDRVFWQRDTDSLTYTAQIRVSSGDASMLNDFKLLDTTQLWTATPWEGTWVPAAEDTERCVEIVFPRETDLTEIRLYDNPSPTDNVLDALIRLDSGFSVHTGALEPNGSATVVALAGEKVKRVEIRLLETEGERAGLTEVEACNGSRDWGLDFVKLQNKDGDFVYDYYIDKSGSESFALYTSGHAPALTENDYILSCDSPACSAVIRGGEIQILCPKGQTCTVTVRTADGRLSDSVRVSNPGWLRNAGQTFEAFVNHNIFARLENSNGYRLLRHAYRLARYGSAASA